MSLIPGTSASLLFLKHTIMLFRITLLSALLTFLACSKKSQEEPKTPAELLTQHNWILSAYGYDHNQNGIVDMPENSIQDCEKDNTYTFNLNGTGIHVENLISCGNGISEMSFAWKFIKQQSSIEIGFNELKILKLNENEFAMYTELENAGLQPIKFITSFKH
jgi:hypothetical protein